MIVAFAALALAGCGGGGGGDSSADVGSGGTGGVTTYGNTTLPGRLVVNAGGGKGAEVFNLRTAQRAGLPASSKDPEHDLYHRRCRCGCIWLSRSFDRTIRYVCQR